MIQSIGLQNITSPVFDPLIIPVGKQDCLALLETKHLDKPIICTFILQTNVIAGKFIDEVETNASTNPVVVINIAMQFLSVL